MLIPKFSTGTGLDKSNKLSEAYKEIEYEIKKSRFIARLYQVESKEQAKEALNNARIAYPDARHHCWAYIILSGSSAAMSDDGEPSGTAGKPILNVLQHKDISDTLIVVSRYFGGIKLGAGGLVRSYARAAQMVVDTVAFIEPTPMVEYRLEFGFALEQTLRHLLEKAEGELFGLEYLDQVSCSILVPEKIAATFVEKLEAHSISYFE